MPVCRYTPIFVSSKKTGTLEEAGIATGHPVFGIFAETRARFEIDIETGMEHPASRVVFDQEGRGVVRVDFGKPPGFVAGVFDTVRDVRLPERGLLDCRRHFGHVERGILPLSRIDGAP